MKDLKHLSRHEARYSEPETGGGYALAFIVGMMFMLVIDLLLSAAGA